MEVVSPSAVRAGGSRTRIDATVVHDLVASQFPHWAGLPVRPVEPGGWDNLTFLLGDDMSVRLPSGPSYAPQVHKEQTWLPRLAPHLPLPIPEPLALGGPSAGFPFPWSIYRWLPGEAAATAPIGDMTAFALDLARFLNALRAVDPSGGPGPGQHSFFRGAEMTFRDRSRPMDTPGNWGTVEKIRLLRDRLDVPRALEVWTDALTATWDGPPVWVHGDVAAGNLLVKDGRLSAVIDFGCAAVGDPACDVTIAWTFFSGQSREAFRDALDADAATWARGRGWALWKACLVMAGSRGRTREGEHARRTIEAILADRG